MHEKDFSGAIKFLNQADAKASRYGHYYDLLWQIELAKAFIYLRQKDFVQTVSTNSGLLLESEDILIYPHRILFCMWLGDIFRDYSKCNSHAR
jgi:hypothetical protein